MELRQHVIELDIVLNYEVGVGDPKPDNVMRAAHDPETREALKKLVDEGRYDVFWPGHEG